MNKEIVVKGLVIVASALTTLKAMQAVKRYKVGKDMQEFEEIMEEAKYDK